MKYFLIKVIITWEINIKLILKKDNQIPIFLKSYVNFLVNQMYLRHSISYYFFIYLFCKSNIFCYFPTFVFTVDQES